MGAFDVVGNITLPDPTDLEKEAAFRRKYHWEAHEMVILKGQFTGADQEALENVSSTFANKKKIQETGQAAEMQVGTARIELLWRVILDWTFSSNGRKVAVSPDAIRRLPPHYFNPILEACDAIAKGMTEDEQETFLPSVNGHSPTNLEEANVSLNPSY